MTDMTEAKEKLLRSFQRYYNIHQENMEPPFFAKAEFHSHDEQYFLIKIAKVSEQESHEYVYFAEMEALDESSLKTLDEKVWTEGLSHADPGPNHRSSDVTLIILAEQIEEAARKLIPKLNHYKSYRFGLRGYSSYRLIALELSTGKMAYNRHGQNLKKLVSNIL